MHRRTAASKRSAPFGISKPESYAPISAKKKRVEPAAERTAGARPLLRALVSAPLRPRLLHAQPPAHKIRIVQLLDGLQRRSPVHRRESKPLVMLAIIAGRLLAAPLLWCLVILPLAADSRFALDLQRH